ncbi:hypothetical protein K2X30_09945 [bacterium]|nr:hypothetical protein [bacterium]
MKSQFALILLVTLPLSSPAFADGCDNICNDLVSSSDGSWDIVTRGGGKGSIKGIPGQGGAGWDSADDNWCSFHKNGSSAGSAFDGKGPNDLVAAPGCPYRVTNSDVAAAGSAANACEYVSKGVKRCDLRGGQIEEQCLAYMSAGDGSKWQYILLALDLTAAGSCAMACFSSVASGGTTESVCQYAGIAAGGTELIATLAMKNSTVGTLINGVAAGAGAYSANALWTQNGGGVQNMGIFQGSGGTGTAAVNPNVADAGGIQSQINAAYAPKPTAPVSTAGNYSQPLSQSQQAYNQGTQGVHMGQQVDPVTGNTPAQNAAKPTQAQETKTKASCYAAAAFGVLTGLRGHSILGIKKTKDQACGQIQSLQGSQNVAINWNGVPGMAVSASQGGIGSGANQGGLGTGGSIGKLPQGIAGVPPVALQAVDGNLLSKTGLDRALGSEASKLNPDAIMNTLSSGGAGGLMKSALGNAANTPAGDSLTRLAQTSQDSATVFLGAVPGATMMGGGGGGAGPSGGGKEPGFAGALASLLGGEGGDRSPAGASMTNFGNPAGNTDIWHAGSTDNIFQIVTRRIERVTSRVVQNR